MLQEEDKAKVFKLSPEHELRIEIDFDAKVKLKVF